MLGYCGQQYRSWATANIINVGILGTADSICVGGTADSIDVGVLVVMHEINRFSVSERDCSMEQYDWLSDIESETQSTLFTWRLNDLLFMCMGSRCVQLSSERVDWVSDSASDS